MRGLLMLDRKQNPGTGTAAKVREGDLSYPRTQPQRGVDRDESRVGDGNERAAARSVEKEAVGSAGLRGGEAAL